MTTTALTSELEAINTLLAAIGESGINTLEVTGLADVASAKRTLDEISRTVQTVGYHFNTEDEYPLPRDTSGTITLPQNTLKMNLAGDASVIQRGLRLYNKEDHSYAFAKDLEGTLVFLLPWDELPEVARHYIMIRASRVFQARTLGSDTQFQFSEDEERKALTSLQEAEGETGNHNIFSSPSVQSIMAR